MAITIGNLYAAKTIEMCAPGDPVCFPGGRDCAAHSAYKDRRTRSWSTRTGMSCAPQRKAFRQRLPRRVDEGWPPTNCLTCSATASRKSPRRSRRREPSSL
jgi:hypothetical protein